MEKLNKNESKSVSIFNSILVITLVISLIILNFTNLNEEMQGIIMFISYSFGFLLIVSALTILVIMAESEEYMF